jgi:hypothetical protein
MHRAHGIPVHIGLRSNPVKRMVLELTVEPSVCGAVGVLLLLDLILYLGRIGGVYGSLL